MITELRVHVHGAPLFQCLRVLLVRRVRLYVSRPVVARLVELHVWWPREADGPFRCSTC